MVEMNAFRSMLSSSVQKSGQTQPLRPGQMLMGNILELYPNQKAAIQLGGKQVVAQLETALTARKQYLFQVSSVGDVIRLRKITDAPQQSEQGLDRLLQQLGVSTNRQTKAFFQQMLTQGVPFTRESGQQIASLLATFGNDSSSQQLLLSMINRRLPLTDQVFQSLQQYQTSSITEQMSSLQNMIQSSSDSTGDMRQSLQRQLQFFTNQQSTNQISQPLQTMIQQQGQAIFSLLQRMGGLPSDMTLNHFQQQINQSLSATSHNVNQANLSLSAIQSRLQSALQTQVSLQPSDHQVLQRVTQQLSQISDNPSQSIVTNVKSMMESQGLYAKIQPALTSSESLSLQSWRQSGQPSIQQTQSVEHLLNRVQTQQLPQGDQQLARELLLHLSRMRVTESLPVKDEFVHLMKQFVQTSGIQDEAQMMQQNKDQNFSIKQMLMLLNQQGQEGAVSERATRLLQSLTGMQLHMANQDVNLSQVALQIPAERFGLAKDIQLQLEGKPKETGGSEIDPDFCRILFHLDLERMGETMMAVSIQKRMIRLTVYNDQKETKALLSSFEPLLRNKLELLGYQLSSVHWKEMTGSEHTFTTSQPSPMNQYTQERIDFRV
ncbi:hypothetical protein J416_00884 [Gracilibacillus halophilus YIM-C55.5]|uniref:Flagellar hook-length control protein-like C-terminal domain-containing protein n=1 Tax=Gracilibacillus halophilus YIM-C55.5 TaxID=1308866 RepID=N4WYX6_9BACI|nr:hypothetical protein [Gracilibacillus halophilus]ENH98256.1 hypothetical protein J416_00884 [Gracilibacillus halophilus YIM-C55.5]